MKIPALALLACGLTGAALAQPSTIPAPARETVIVTAPKLHAGVTPNAVAHDFIKSFATPSVLTESIARWQTPICPDFLGIAPQFASVMAARLRTIAGEAGAALKEKDCRHNLYVVVTSQPQAYLDALHAKSLDALGYRGATTVTHPVQAWYVTGIADLHGQTWVDQESWGFTYGSNYMSFNGPRSQVGGWRFHPDVTSDLLYATIIVDSAAASHSQVGAIADYVAMLALSRSDDYGDCQLMPSIANLLTPNCDDKLKPGAITASDIAYLKGVYKMDPGAKLQIQQDQIAAEMQKSLGGQ